MFFLECLPGRDVEGDQEVVGKMEQDRGQQAVGEHDPEEVHTHEPGVDKADRTLVSVAVSEKCIGPEHCCANSPSCFVEDVRLEVIKGCPIGQRSPGTQVEQFWDSKTQAPKEQEVNEGQDGDCS